MNKTKNIWEYTREEIDRLRENPPNFRDNEHLFVDLMSYEAAVEKRGKEYAERWRIWLGEQTQRQRE